MAIIYSYPEIPDVQGGDLLLISDTGAPNKPTRSVDIDDLAAYIGTVIGIGFWNLGTAPDSIFTTKMASIGQDANIASSKLNVYKTDDMTASVPHVATFNESLSNHSLNLWPSPGNNSADIYGSVSRGAFTGSGTVDQIKGIESIGRHSGSGSVNIIQGTHAAASLTGAGSVKTIAASYAKTFIEGTGSNNIENAFGAWNVVELDGLNDVDTIYGTYSNVVLTNGEVNDDAIGHFIGFDQVSADTEINNAYYIHAINNSLSVTGEKFFIKDETGIPSQFSNKLVLNAYGSGTFTGTATQRLAVDTNGNVIEIPIGSGPVDGSGTANYTARWIDTDTLGIGALYDNGTNVGIGATSPDSLLEISTADTTKDFIKLTSGGGSVNPSLIFEKSTAEQGVIQYIRNGDLKIYNTDNDGGVMLSGSGATNYDMYINNSGNVGIGTTSPSDKLSVAGNLSTFHSGHTTKALRVTMNSNDALLSLYSRTNQSSQQVLLRTNGNSYLNGGNVGIGTTSPSEKLEVAGQYGNTTLSGHVVGFTRASANYLWAKTSGGDLRFTVNGNAIGSPSMTLSTAGNLGIGTTSPSQKLQVVGNARVTGAYYDSNNSPGTANQVLVSTATGTDWVDGSGSGIIGGPYLPLTGGTLSGNLTITKSSAMMKVSEAGGGDIRMVAGGSTGYVGTYNNTSMQILQNGSNAIFIDTSKNIGIGTTNPTHKLEVVGDSNDTMRVYRPGNRTLLNIDADAGRTSALAIDIAGTTQYYVGMPTQAVSGLGARFAISYKGAPSFVLEGSSGNIGIGTTSPSEKLEVDGNIKLTGNLNVGGYISPNDESGNLSIFGGNDTTNDAQILLHGSSNYWGSLELNYGYDAVNSFFKISQGANEHLRITNGGKVGIGTTSPSEKLHVDAGKMLITHTSTEQYNYKYGNSDTWSFGGGDYYTIKKAGIRLFTLNGAGNVGIGTNNPSTRLHVDGDIRQEGSTYSVSITGGASITGDNHLDIAANASYLNLRSPNNSIFYRASSDHAFKDAGGSNEYLRIKTSGTTAGNVGIGTTNPTSALHVNGGTGALSTGLTFGDGDTGIWEASDDNLRFSTVSSTRMIITSAGNVGIGTASPSEKLEVSGKVKATSEILWGNNNSNPVGRLYAGSQTAVLLNTSTDGFVQISGGNATSNGGNIGLSGSTNADPNTIRFRIGGGEVMRVAANTNLGIGTTAPTTKLHVNGDIRIQGSNELYFGGTGSVPNWEIKASGSDLIVNDTGTNVGSVLFNNDEGVALPRLTTTEINAISLPAQGLMAYNTTLNTICFYNGSSWQKVSHANM